MLLLGLLPLPVLVELGDRQLPEQQNLFDRAHVLYRLELLALPLGHRPLLELLHVERDVAPPLLAERLDVPPAPLLPRLADVQDVVVHRVLEPLHGVPLGRSAGTRGGVEFAPDEHRACGTDGPVLLPEPVELDEGVHGVGGVHGVAVLAPREVQHDAGHHALHVERRPLRRVGRRTLLLLHEGKVHLAGPAERLEDELVRTRWGSAVRDCRAHLLGEHLRARGGDLRGAVPPVHGQVLDAGAAVQPAVLPLGVRLHGGGRETRPEHKPLGRQLRVLVADVDVLDGDHHVRQDLGGEPEEHGLLGLFLLDPVAGEEVERGELLALRLGQPALVRVDAAGGRRRGCSGAERRGEEHVDVAHLDHKRLPARVEYGDVDEDRPDDPLLDDDGDVAEL